jgi:MFS family permease
VPLLRDEQGTSRAVAGLHGTALAVGTIISSAVSVPLIGRFRRRGTLIGATVVAAAGILLLAVGPSVPFTLAGALVAGVGGSSLLNAVNPVLSDHHGRAGPAAISEANAIAAGCGIIAPLALGLGVSLGLTWRGAILISLPLAALSVFLVARAPRLAALTAGPGRGPSALEPTSAVEDGVEAGLDGTGQQRVPLGTAFWLALGLVIACVGVEFSTTFWAADLLHTNDHLDAGAASAAISAFLVGMTVGRLSAVPLTRRYSTSRLLLGALSLSLVGWAIFWSAHSSAFGVGGIALLGLGLAFTYPLGLIRLMEASQGRPDTANALSSLGVGVASGSAPFALGALADHIGSHGGFVLVPGLLVTAGGLLLASAWFNPTGLVQRGVRRRARLR